MIFLIFIQILTERSASKQWRPDQTPHSAVSGLGLHFLPMSHKKDTRLKWVNIQSQILYRSADIIFLMAQVFLDVPPRTVPL